MATVVRFVRLEFVEGTSSKFHEQYVMSSGSQFLHKAVWGRIGTPGTTQKARPRCAAAASALRCCDNAAAVAPHAARPENCRRRRRTGRGLRTTTTAPRRRWR